MRRRWVLSSLSRYYTQKNVIIIALAFSASQVWVRSPFYVLGGMPVVMVVAAVNVVGVDEEEAVCWWSVGVMMITGEGWWSTGGWVHERLIMTTCVVHTRIFLSL